MTNGNDATTLVGDDPDQAWQRWKAQRVPAQLVHLDTAAAGRSSMATLRATASHAEREAAVGRRAWRRQRRSR